MPSLAQHNPFESDAEFELWYQEQVRPWQILHLEDEPHDSELVERFSQGFNRIITPAHSGAEAVDLFHRHKYRYILLDIKMPGTMDGLDVLKVIRHTDAVTPILIVAGAYPQDAIERIRSIGNCGLYPKPHAFNDTTVPQIFRHCGIPEIRKPPMFP